MIEYHNISKTTLWIAWMPNDPGSRESVRSVRGWWLYWPSSDGRTASFGLTEIYFTPPSGRMSANSGDLRKLKVENGRPYIDEISFADYVVLEAMYDRAVLLEARYSGNRPGSIEKVGPFQVSL